MQKTHPDFRFLVSRPGRFFALGCGLGLAPKAPGTFGTLGGFILAGGLAALPVPLWVNLVIIATCFVVGCAICDEAGRALGEADHGSIVWDEIVSFALVLICVPFSLVIWVAAFLLFRLFDILKPWPISVADARFKNGFGVMLDDLIAAGFALCVLWAVFLVWPIVNLL